MWRQLQATLNKTPEGTRPGWEAVPDQVRHSTDTIVSRERDHITQAGGRAEVETVGKSPHVYEGTGEGTKDCSAENRQDAEEKDGESASVRKQLHHGREGQMSLLRGDGS